MRHPLPRGPIAVIGLAFGDEGKGSCVDYLARVTGAPWVVRFNGGPQAAHHVVSPSGQAHCFAQFGSGTLAPGVQTLLAHPMLIDPLALEKEHQALQRLGLHAVYPRLSIDPRCVIVTPFHALLNRLRETVRGQARHGSCGMGVGEAWQDLNRPSYPILRWQDLARHNGLTQTLADLQADKIAQAEALLRTTAPLPPEADRYLEDLRLAHLPAWLADRYHRFCRASGVKTASSECLAPALRQRQTVIFEGAQGVLLDKDAGFWPYVTPSTTTFAPAATVLAETQVSLPLHRIGVIRAYSVRHGAGPFVTEDAALTAALPDRHNGLSPWQGAVRVGWFDAVAARYALQVVGGVEGLMLTNVDRLVGQATLPVCTAYHDGARPVALTAPETQAAQAQLTQQVLRCQPHWQILPGWADVSPTHLPTAFQAYCAYLEAYLATPISGCSAGPTAQDKWQRTATGANLTAYR